MIKITVKKAAPGAMNPYTATVYSGQHSIASHAGKTRQEAWNNAVRFVLGVDSYQLPPGGLLLRETRGVRKRRTARPRAKAVRRSAQVNAQRAHMEGARFAAIARYERELKRG